MLSIFLEFLQAIKCPQGLEIFFYEFTNIPELPEGAKYFSRISTSHTKFRIFFYEFINIPGLSEGAKYFSRTSTSHTKSPKLGNIFLWI